MNEQRKSRGKPWSLLLTLAGLLVGVISVLVAVYKPGAEVSFHTISQVNVLDVHKPLRELTVIFRGKDVQQEDLNLRILTVRIENTGRVDILEGLYDHSQPWGLRVRDGEIIEARIVGGNDGYLRRRMRAIQLHSGLVEFPKCIVDCDKYVLLEILVLHKKDNTPVIVPVGKIAGIDRFATVGFVPEERSSGLGFELFHGSAWINTLRFVINTLILILVTALAVGVAAARDDRRTRARRAAREQDVRQLQEEGLLDVEDIRSRCVSELYLTHGLRGLTQLQVFFTRDDMSGLVWRSLSTQDVDFNVFADLGSQPREFLEIAPIGSAQILTLVAAGIIVREDDEYIVHPSMDVPLPQIVERLREMHPR